MLTFKGKKVLVFDLDKTLVDLMVDWDYVKEILADKYSKLYGKACNFKSITKCFNYIVEKGDVDELQNFYSILEKYELKNIKNSKIIDETVFFIKNLNLFGLKRHKIKLAILSLNMRKTIIRSLKIHNLETFDFIVGREDVIKWKPNPEGLLKIIKHFKVKSEEVLYFGDLQRDVETGENAGVEAYLIDQIILIVKNKKEELNSANFSN